jgi:hypothetical protein
VQDVLEKVTIGAGRHALEEIATDDVAAVRNAEMLKGLAWPPATTIGKS